MKVVTVLLVALLVTSYFDALSFSQSDKFRMCDAVREIIDMYMTICKRHDMSREQKVKNMAAAITCLDGPDMNRHPTARSF